MLTKICTKCSKELPATNEHFYWRNDNGKLRNDCKSCRKSHEIERNRNPIYAEMKKNREVERRLNNRLLVINHYGGKCKECGESRIEFLTIDHTGNNGAEHRKLIGGSQYLYNWLIKNNFPPGFQVLCHNHNAKKELEHQKLRLKIDNPQARYKRRKRYNLRMQVISYYGSKCQCCGEDHTNLITIDHIGDDGAEHRKEIKNKGFGIYDWLIKNNFPLGFQILCWNCNLAKSIYGQCPHRKGGG